MQVWRKVTGLVMGLCLAIAAVAEGNSRWSAELAAFAAADEIEPRSRGGVVFVGSSSIRLWGTLGTDFPTVRVMNRGFGGSTLRDSVHHFDLLVARHAPRLVVLYAGTNDLADGTTPEEVAATFREFCQRLHAVLPGTNLWFLSIVPAPARWEMREMMIEANRLVAEECRNDPRLRFVNATAGLLDAAGAPMPDCFVEDKLHLSARGYAAWRALLAADLDAYRDDSMNGGTESAPMAN